MQQNMPRKVPTAKIIIPLCFLSFFTNGNTTPDEICKETYPTSIRSLPMPGKEMCQFLCQLPGGKLSKPINMKNDTSCGPEKSCFFGHCFRHHHPQCSKMDDKGKIKGVDKGCKVICFEGEDVHSEWHAPIGKPCLSVEDGILSHCSEGSCLNMDDK